MQLKNTMSIIDTYQIDALKKLDTSFLAQLATENADVHQQLLAAREQIDGLDKKAESTLLVQLAPYVERFLSHLFDLDILLHERQQEAKIWHHMFVDIKRKFVQRRSLKKFNAENLDTLDAKTLIDQADHYIGPLNSNATSRAIDQFERSYAKCVSEWLLDEEHQTEALTWATQYAAWATLSQPGQERHALGRLFRRPAGIDPHQQVSTKTISWKTSDPSSSAVHRLAGDGILRQRDGFHLTDHLKGSAYVYDQSHYCIWCHAQDRDSCSIGLKDKKTNEVQKSALGITLAGCPLSEKISEMNYLKAMGYTIAPVAMAMIDNPMVLGTGHRICNDCMKSCIYQKQEPVDIPQAETRNVEDVLSLPYGYEIYMLLARWNPLNLRRPLPRTATGHKVLVVGLGPAGYTLSHHLLQEGHTVVAIDGLKIEPLPPSVSGRALDGTPVPFSAIQSLDPLMEDLDNRILAGFGGVSEYGITVRWNKNYLKLLRIMLERHPAFRLYGGIRFGNDSGTLTIEDALALGFDHIALCMGAGKPTVVDLENGFASGVRQASDFLMALQLTGASKANSLANLQIRMPIVVIGGGLTAIDTATESLAYYIRQVERFTRRHQELKNNHIDDLNTLSTSEREIADTFLAHGQAVISEREKAELENRLPHFLALAQKWGGVTVVYRRTLKASPAYVLNHEEVSKAMEEGIYFAEQMTPIKVAVDDTNACTALHCKDHQGTEVIFPAKSILVAAGTQPNTVLQREISKAYGGGTNMQLDGKYFAAIDANGNPIQPAYANTKPDRVDVLTHRFDDGRMMSFFGDLHPSFFGNVTKAMASAKQGYPIVDQVLRQRSPHNTVTAPVFFRTLDQQLLARIVYTKRLTHNIVEIVIHAPQAAKNFRPGQFYRLQNFETLADRVITQSAIVPLTMEGIALTGAWVNIERGEVGLIVLEMGGTSNLCIKLKPNDPVVLLGPTGSATHIHRDETVLLAGGGLGNAVLFSIGAAFRAAGSKVLYFAAYRNHDDRYHIKDIEAAADVIIWCCDTNPGFTPSSTRPQDRSFVGNIVQAMQAYAEGRLGDVTLPLSQVNRIIAIGSDKMMAAVAKARHTVLKPYLSPDHCGIGSINSPMQCMMKEICSQCLQRHYDPQTGKAFTVFSCFNQDQNLDTVDWDMLATRLRQNVVQEKQTAAFLRYSLSILSPEEHKQSHF